MPNDGAESGPDLPGKIGKYEIVDHAGEGSMGVVYVGIDPATERRIAIKVCPTPDDQTRSSRVTRKLFFNEARASASLKHPNILEVLDSGEQDGHPYIVMEYVEGAGTLREFVDPNNLLPLRRAIEIVYRCAKALDYAHRRGVIHRDIKPSNVMLARDGSVKLGDFGVAHYAFSDLTQVMGMMGSPRYMSPEQARDEEVNHQTDLFSLGIVLYELITGRPPFAARGFSELIKKITEADAPPLAERREDVPPALETVVQRMLAKRPEDRYPDGQTLALDLASIYQGLVEVADTIRPEQRTQVVRELSFFNDFSDEELEEVSSACTWVTRNRGESIISEGQLEHAFYIIARGQVSVVKSGSQISTLETGDCFGEMGYLARTERSATIIADESVTLLKINSTLIEKASLPCQLRFTQVFLHTLINRLARTSEQLLQHVR